MIVYVFGASSQQTWIEGRTDVWLTRTRLRSYRGRRHLQMVAAKVVGSGGTKRFMLVPYRTVANALPS